MIIKTLEIICSQEAIYLCPLVDVYKSKAVELALWQQIYASDKIF